MMSGNKSKDKRLLTLPRLICLALVLAVLPYMAACSKLASSTAPGEAVYTVLDPRSWEPEVEFQGLSPRLDTLEGKKVIVVNLHGGNEEIMESIASDLKAAVPGCDVVYYPVKGRWDRLEKEDWDTILNCDAAILGHNY